MQLQRARTQLCIAVTQITIVDSMLAMAPKKIEPCGYKTMYCSVGIGSDWKGMPGGFAVIDHSSAAKACGEVVWQVSVIQRCAAAM